MSSITKDNKVVMTTNIPQQAGGMVLTSLVAGTVLSILGPFGTIDYSMPLRVIYWVGLCMVGAFGAAAFDRLAYPSKWPNTLWYSALRKSLGASLPVALTLIASGTIILGWHGWLSIISTSFFVWFTSILICVLGEIVTHKKDSITPQELARPALIERLKPNLRSAEIYALSAQDHYVNVITSKGKDLIFMRLTDAIQEVHPLPGLSPHRSWWVAENGVKKVSKSEGKVSLILHDDSNVPVSRNSSKLLREAGWF